MVRVRGIAAILVALLAAGCGTASTPAPSPLASGGPATPSPTAIAPATSGSTPAPTATPAGTATPAPAHADTLRVGWPEGQALWNGFRDALWPAVPGFLTLGHAIYSGLYRYDARLAAIPDLADGPCVPQGDGTVIRCRLIETTFQDGTPLTAEDVAYSFRLNRQDTMPREGPEPATGSMLEVRVVDPRTVDFVLTAIDPTFFTDILPTIPILPRHAMEAAYAEFRASLEGMTSADLTKLADTIDEETRRDPPVCTAHIDEAEALVERMGPLFYREDFTDGAGTLDACGYVSWLSWGFLRSAATALDRTGLASVAAAYQLLWTDWPGRGTGKAPVGIGPYRFVSEEPGRVHLEAWPGYHGGVAATRYLDFVPAKDDGSDLVAGTVDILQLYGAWGTPGPAFQAAGPSRGVRVATAPNSGYYALQFNARPGRLFADVALRKALQLCVDVPRDVDAASGGTGIAIYGPVIAGSWADDPALPRPARDTAAAKALIDGAGWRLGADGIYAKDGVRLSAAIPVRGDIEERVKMADLIAHQARDCGMDLHSQPLSGDDVYAKLLVYPHHIPGTDRPFDLYLGGWILDVDPADALSVFLSSAITDAEHPDGATSTYHDSTGFSDPTIDRLYAAAAATYDQAERADLTRQMLEELAAQVPYLFLSAEERYDIVRSSVTTPTGPLDLTTPNWAWQPERMVVEKAKP